MTLSNLKFALAGGYVVVIAGVALLSGVTSSVGLVAFGALALLPAGALLVLWNDPQQSMSETIRGARR